MSRLVSMKTLGLALIALGLAAMLVAVPRMVARMEARDPGDLTWFLDPITTQSFDYRGLPVRIEVIEPESYRDQELPIEAALLPRKERALARIEWRGERFEIPIEGLDDPRLPELLRFDDWMRVLVMAIGPRTREDLINGLESGDVQPRLVIATRLPPEDYDPKSWGLVRRAEWRYTFVELLAEGQAPASETSRVIDGVFGLAEGTYREIDDLGSPTIRAERGREGDHWMYASMLQITPTALYRSTGRNRPIQDSFGALGWTWTVTLAGGLALVVGITLLIASPDPALRATGDA
ncbi:MAG: hypothetical protein AAGD00_07070 [Planctomycetota bacterium]